MNYIWSGMILASLICGAINGTLEETVTAAMDGAGMAVTTLLSFAGAMCFWTGLLKIGESSGMTDRLCRILKKPIGILFPHTDDMAKKYIAMNMSANILGMGNAATPMGIKAMERLDKINNGSVYASDAMCMLVVLNTTSFQLIPATILSLRSAAGSSDPFSVIVPIWIASGVSVICAILMAKLVCKIFRGGRKCTT